jgi:hypothetical protein
MLLKLIYWVAVLAVSIVLVVALILFLESRDKSSLEGADAHVVALAQRGDGI